MAVCALLIGAIFDLYRASITLKSLGPDRVRSTARVVAEGCEQGGQLSVLGSVLWA